MDNSNQMNKNVLISLSDKTNLDLLVKTLIPKGYTIFSTGGTYKKILEYCQDFQFPADQVIAIDSYINFPEILGGRVKTLHPRIYGGILENQSKESDLQDLENHNLEVFDFIFVNLYPFEETLKKYGFDFTKNQKPEFLSSEDELDIIESIDIGGVSLIRASAKNYQYCLPIIDPTYYYEFMTDVFQGKLTLNQRIKYAQKAFECVAEYDNLIDQFYLTLPHYQKLREQESQKNEKRIRLKYGLNPHQKDAFLSWTDKCLENQFYPFQVLNGNDKLGYINLIDAIQSYLLVSEAQTVFHKPCVASFKHTSPAGVAIGQTVADAYQKARGGDPLSSFGDFIAVSGTVDIETAKLIKKEVTDGIIASDFTTEAFELLKTKKNGNYLILMGNEKYLEWYLENNKVESRELFGMVLSQSPNQVISDSNFLEKSSVVTLNKELPEEAKEDLLLANISLKYAQSNNISFAYQGQIIGLSAGQQNRVDSVVLAGKKAERWFLRQSPMVEKIMGYLKADLTLKRQDKVNLVMEVVKNYQDRHLEKTVRGDNSYRERYLEHFTGYNNPRELFLDVEETDKYLEEKMKNISMASDAFFPFDDNIVRAYQYGVQYILHPGGSLADKKCIETANNYNMVMITSRARMFYH